MVIRSTKAKVHLLFYTDNYEKYECYNIIHIMYVKKAKHIGITMWKMFLGYVCENVRIRAQILELSNFCNRAKSSPYRRNDQKYLKNDNYS